MFSPEEGKAVKMSKSKGNVVGLDDAIARFGADATRIATLYLGPPELDAEWDKESDKVFAGPYRFLERVWRFAQLRSFDKNWREKLTLQVLAEASASHRDLDRKTQQTIKRVGHDIERFSFNTALAAQMEFINALYAWHEANKNDDSEIASIVYSQAVEKFVVVSVAICAARKRRINGASWVLRALRLNQIGRSSMKCARARKKSQCRYKLMASCARNCRFLPKPVKTNWKAQLWLRRKSWRRWMAQRPNG